MKPIRPLIAAAAFGLLACPVLAEASVTLFGVVDAGIEFVNNQSSGGSAAGPGPAANRVAMQSGSQAASRWGLRGEEDLGGGLQAFFVLDNGFAVDSGRESFAGRLFGRQALVGLGGPYGKLSFGRQYGTLFDTLSNFQPAAYQTLYEPTTALLGKHLREDNTVKYVGSFGALTARAHWSFGVDSTSPATAGEVPGRIRDGSGWGFGGNYASGRFGAGVAFDQVNTAAAPGVNAKAQRAAVAASFAPASGLRFMAGYRWARGTSPAGAVVLRDDLFWVGGFYDVTPAWQVATRFDYDNVKQMPHPVTQAPLGDIANPWQLMLVNKYALSKRTNLYLTTAYARNASLKLENPAGVQGSGYVLGAGKKSMFGAVAGIRHVF